MKTRSWWLYILFFFFSQLAGGGVAYALAATGVLTGMWSLIVSLLVANLLAIGLFLLWRPYDITWAATLAGVHGRKGRRTGLVFLMALPIIILVNLIQEAFFPELPDLVGEETFKAIMYNPLGMVTVALLGPVAEELLFRGGVQKDLQTRYAEQGPAVAIALSAVLFAIAHMNPAQMPAALILGLVLGFAFWWTGSLAASICIHVFNNSMACFLSLLSPDDDSLIHFLGGTEQAGVLAVVCVFFLLIILHVVRNEAKKGMEKD